MKLPKLMIQAAILLATLQLGIYQGRKLEAVNHSKPYIIIYEEVTQGDYDRCASDSNCMDVMKDDVLPTRDDIAEGSDLANCQLNHDCDQDFMARKE